MARRRLGERNTRKLLRLGQSLGMTLPAEFLRKLKWRKGQKVTVRLSGKKLIITDWER